MTFWPLHAFTPTSSSCHTSPQSFEIYAPAILKVMAPQGHQSPTSHLVPRSFPQVPSLAPTTKDKFIRGVWLWGTQLFDMEMLKWKERPNQNSSPQGCATQIFPPKVLSTKGAWTAGESKQESGGSISFVTLCFILKNSCSFSLWWHSHAISVEK